MTDSESTTVAQRGLASSDSPNGTTDHAQEKSRLFSAQDVNAELAEIGLSSKSGWYASIVLYGAGGLVTVALGLLRPDLVPVGVTILGFCSLLLAGVSAIGARYLSTSDWATHMRLGAGLAIFLTGAVVAGDLRQAFVLLPLFVLITPTFLYGTRFAVPYATIVPLFTFAVLLATPGPARIAHAVITVGAELMIVISFIIAERHTRKLARINRRLAYTDPLTGIANTRRLRERLAELLGRPDGVHRPFALFAIDLDNFKLVNDTFDHSTGDRVLRAVATALADEVEDDDLVARRGGDEFSVLVANPEARDLDKLTNRLARAIENARRATCPQITPTGSVAYVRSRAEDTIARVLQRADDKLHAKKTAFHEHHGHRDSTEVKVLLGGLKAGEAAPRHVDRRAALRSVSAAVSRAYAPRRASGVNAAYRQAAGRMRQSFRGVDLDWVYMMVMVIPGGVAVPVLSLLGLLAPLPVWAGVMLGVVYLSLGAFSLHCARHRLAKTYSHIVFSGCTLTLTAVLLMAGSAGAALLDIYAVLALYAFYWMSARVAGVYLLLCSALYTMFAIAGDYPYGGIRAGVTVSVLFVAAAIVVRVRSLTLRYVRENQELSEVDALTGVANLRALESRVEYAVGQAHHGSRRPVIVTVDLDKFKEVNDSYNHTVGDQMLEAVARAVAETVRVDELVARRGGDEFFVLFNDASTAEIDAIVPRLREAVRHARQRICPDLTPTASVGYVVWKPGQDALEFMHNADLAMHDEKIETRAGEFRDAASA